MVRRIGVRMRKGFQSGADVFGADLGEDWVVPREPLAFLLVREVPSGALLSAYGAGGHLVGDRFVPTIARLEGLLQSLHERGLCTAPREVPPGAGSALRWLRDLEDPEG